MIYRESSFENGYIYYSFTTKIVKATLSGEIAGTVEGIVGHLGCITFNEKDGCVYGSLEYKNDVIGKGILEAVDSYQSFDDAFYVAKFDVSKIDRIGMSAEKDGIMTAMYLKAVTDDYNGTGIDKEGNSVPHNYGCSGIDGLTFAPLPAETDLHLRCTNISYIRVIRVTECRILNMMNIQKHFLWQFMRGRKMNFRIILFFASDCEKKAVRKFSEEINEHINILELKKCGEYDEKSGLYGWHFPYGSTELFSYGDGDWLISHDDSTSEGQCSYIYHYKWDNVHSFECLTENSR